ncbi:GNAT family N-acetyltransferase [Xanthocytophaga agilis]|uniref:GNAT family N-acetyltransferase n=1 Tax=Xanthocytophaga agilis TaxID=3048010 RepID=A0AAE3R4R5_9BACT|nr:GNAT family N-acetyltransferase [Xanthocytophaga agilis]MDJ1503906.1 GNAT family N-acetyltransferase [Xanthocytophaga agilis]
MQLENGEYTISTDKTRLDIPLIHHFLSTKSYWAINIPYQTVQKSIENSLCFGVYQGKQQVGFARVITDFATVAYLGDVFIQEEYRKNGLSKWLVETITSHPELQGLRRWVLLTSDAHTLYEKYGFKVAARPENWMEKHNPDVYKNL